jgi:hypothetical protein
VVAFEKTFNFFNPLSSSMISLIFKQRVSLFYLAPNIAEKSLPSKREKE